MNFRFQAQIKKSRIACVLFTVFCIAFFSSQAESAFIDRGGVRPMGMGGAFVALADDTSAVMFNPAGLGQIEKAQITAAYDKLYAGLGDDNLGRGFISYVQPAQDYGAFALNLALLNVPLYKETTVTFGYGRAFGPAYVGLNVKGLFASFEENDYTQIDPLFNGNGMSTNEMALDLGFLYKLTDSMSFGLAVMNVNQPNVAIGEDADDKVPLMLQTGIALKLGNTIPTIDLTYRNKDLGDKRDINIHVGMESWLADRSMALRAGVNFYDMAVGASYVFGQGRSVDAQLDYAFRYPLFFKEDAITGTYGTHQFSLNVRFGGFAADQPEAADEQVVKKSETDELMSELASYREEGKNEEADKLFKEALERFQTAVDMAPRDPQPRYDLAMLYKRYGDLTGSKSFYNKAIIELERTRMIDSGFKDVSAQLVTLKKKR